MEHKHQHLLNVVRDLYFQSQVSTQFWTNCVLTTTFIINQLPSQTLQHKSPYELLHSNMIDFSYFCVFGCLEFASTLLVKWHKFSPHAKKSIFIEYPPSIKGYKFYDLETHDIFISRDIIFHKNIFPFRSLNAADFNVDPFPHLILPNIYSSHTLETTHMGEFNMSTSSFTSPSSPRWSQCVSKSPSYKIFIVIYYLTHHHSILLIRILFQNFYLMTLCPLPIDTLCPKSLQIMNHISIIKQLNFSIGKK